MKSSFAQRVTSFVLVLCLMLSALPALADAPSLRAYCHAFAVEASEGQVRGFGFKMGAQYGTEPYTLSYTFAKEGGLTSTGSVSSAGYVSVPGTFGSGVYTFTASVKDAAGALSTAVMNVTFTVDENGNMNSTVNSAVAPQDVKVQEISLGVIAQTLRVGDTFELFATVKPDNAKNKDVTFTSTDESIATVSAAGLITAVKAGSCKVVCTAKDGSGVTSECQVIVVQSVTGVSLSPATVTIPVGGTAKLTAAVTPDNASNKEVTFVSGNKDLAVVANDGTVTGVDMGVVTISVSCKDDPTKIASCVVTVGTPVGSVEVSPKSVELKTGNAIQLSASVLPENATNKTLTWSSSNKDVATVTADGVVSVWKAGTAVITVSSVDGSGKSATCTVTATGDDVIPPEEKPEDKPTTPPEEEKPSEKPSGTLAYVRTEEGGLNLRKGATQGAEIIKVIPQNDALVVIEKGTTWCYVWHGGDYGYVMTKFLSIYTGSTTPDDDDDSTSAGPVTPPTSGEAAQVKTEKGGLNLRLKPSSGAKVLKVIPEKGYFTVVTYGTTWCYAYYNGTYGYVMTKFVRLAGETEPDEDGTVTPPAQQPGADALYARVVTKEGKLNLRATPSSGAKILRRIPQYETIWVITYGSSWCHVAYDNMAGYVMTKFLSFDGVEAPGKPEEPSTPENPAPPAETLYGVVTTKQGRLNLRKSPNSSAGIIKRIDQGETVTVLSYGDTWCSVDYKGTKGYVMTQFLKFTNVKPEEKPEEPVAPPVSDGTKQYAQVTTEQGSLNLRGGKSTGATLLKRIPQNAYVEIINYGSTWCYVNYNGTKGFVMTKFLTVVSGTTGSGSTGTTPPYSDSERKYAKVVTAQGSLNIRSPQSTDASIVGYAPQNAYVQVLETGVTWCKVTYNGKTGYALTEFLDFTHPFPSSEGKQHARLTSTGKLYQQASTSSTLLATIPAGDYVLFYSDGSGWARVYYNGKTGYIPSASLKLREGTVKVNGTKLYEKSTYPATNDSAVLATLNAGVKVTVLELMGEEWWKERLEGGTVGYISALDKSLDTPSW